MATPRLGPVLDPASATLGPSFGGNAPEPDYLALLQNLRAAYPEAVGTAGLAPPAPEALPRPGLAEQILTSFAGAQPNVRPRGFFGNLGAGFEQGLGSVGSRLQEKRAQMEQDIAKRRAQQDAERIQASRDYRQALLQGLKDIPNEQDRRRKIAEQTPGTPEYDAMLKREKAIADATRAPKTQESEPLVAIEGPNGPVYVPRSQAVGKMPAKTQQSEKPRVPSAAERDALITDIGILGQVSGIRDAFQQAPGVTGIVRGRLGGLGQKLGVTSREENRLRGRVAGLRNQILKARSGGAVTEGEASRLLEELPTDADPGSAFIDKLDQFERTYRNIATARRDVFTGTGVDLSRIPGLPKPPLSAFETP